MPLLEVALKVGLVHKAHLMRYIGQAGALYNPSIQEADHPEAMLDRKVEHVAK